MIDGITIKYEIANFVEWMRSLSFSFFTSVNTFETGEIKTKKRNDTTVTTHRGRWETFDLIVKEVLNIRTLKKSYYLTIKGSLHKNHYQGTNYLPFTWQQLQAQISHICNTLFIDPKRAQICLLEIGLNIITPFPVTPFLRHNVISYKGNSFNRYEKDATGICLGIVCNLSQYAVKIYDKGLQNDLPQNLMRFELRYLKMQSLNNRGIKFLSDLQEFARISKLQALLKNAWNEILIFDINENIKILPVKPKEKDLLIEGQNPKFWERLKENNAGDHFKYVRNKFKNLVVKYGKNWQTNVSGLIRIEWENLFKNSPNLPTVKNALLPDLTIKINGKNGENTFELLKHNTKQDTIKKRVCLSCGRDITDQKEGSKFCSAKKVGYELAHQCRNNNSNPRNNFKTKIKKIRGRGLLFDIMPYFTSKAN